MIKRLILTIFMFMLAAQLCYGITPYLRFNVQDFGAVGSGAVDDSTAITNCITSAAGGTVYFPKGTFKLSANVTIPAGVTAQFQNGASWSIDITKIFAVAAGGRLQADFYQIFSGAGTATLAAGTVPFVYPQWWGVVGDGATDNTANLILCINAAGTNTILIKPGNYSMADNVTFGATTSVELISPITFTVSVGGKILTLAGRVFGDKPASAGAGTMVFSSATIDRNTKTVPLVYADPLAVDTDLGTVFTTTTTAIVGPATLNATNGIEGQKIIFLITNDGAGARTITFGANFTPNGTLVGTINLTAEVEFVYNVALTKWVEVNRAIPTIIKNNQDVSTAGSPSFAGITLTGPIAGGIAFDFTDAGPMVGNETFVQADGNVFYKDGGAADRTFNPNAAFQTGTIIFLNNYGATNKITFDSGVLAQDVLPGESAIFFYTGAIWRLFILI